ncbi:DMT family transporter [Candidatus Gracilibacteria bacterium]|nr:DMT family transporter [Candidatus Gracilibacteria bacterium]
MTQLVFLIFIIAGIVLSSFKISELKNFSFKNSKNTLLLALGAAFLWSIEVTFIDRSMMYFHPIVSTWLIEGFALLIVFPFIILKRKKIISEYKKISKTVLMYVGILSCIGAIGNLAFSYAFSFGSLAIVSAIAACSPAITAILSRIFGEETLEYSQYIAIGILVFGISGLTYFSV